MPMMPLSQLPDWQLDEANKDIRGWPVKDTAGHEIGRVKELMVNTDDRTVSSAMLDNGREIPLRDLDQREGFVQWRSAANEAAGNVAAAASQAFYGDNAGNMNTAQASGQQAQGEQASQMSGQGAGQGSAGGQQTRETGAGSGQAATGRAGQMTTGQGQVSQEMAQPASDAAMSGQEEPVIVTIEEELIVITPFDELEPRFREHHQQAYGGKAPYENYQAAYQHGHALASSPEHRGKTWEEVRPHARRTWEEQNPGQPYEDYEQAIGEGYMRVGGL